MSPYLSKKESLNTIGVIGSKATDIFYENVWLNRCKIFAEREKLLGIEHTNKFKVSTYRHNSVPRSNTHHTANPPQRWRTWISYMLDKRTSWMGFHTCINSLIH